MHYKYMGIPDTTTLVERYLEHAPRREQNLNQQQQNTQGQQQQQDIEQQGNDNGRPSVRSPLNKANHIVIWRGMIEWLEMNKSNYNDSLKQTARLPCQMLVTLKDGEPDVSMESWSMKLHMQLIPKVYIDHVGQEHLRNCKYVSYHPAICEALPSLLQAMAEGYAGIVHLKSKSTYTLKMSVILSAARTGTFVGLMPNDQQAFINRLKELLVKYANRYQELYNASLNTSTDSDHQQLQC